MDKSVAALYGNKLRVRVCGICVSNDRLLLVNHRGLTSGDVWSFPGGGLQFGESANECLVREFFEETGLHVEIGEFLFACEFINHPLHAIELFFLVKEIGGQLAVGVDPESGQNQLIQDVQYKTEFEISRTDKAHLHGILKKTTTIKEMVELRGYFKL